ncbi:MAG: ribulose-phosphate 3-epimerase [candidate division Zixibacteria bacterium]|nr:ribulose-phosphate 3-epimerase [candidate division Zixibacteria bacterium]
MTQDAVDQRKVLIAPSLLAADFANLAEELQAVEKAGADLIHLDVMDGRFVPNITFGPGLVKSVRKTTRLPLDVHLMIENPAKFAPRFIEAGADYITVHLEACPHLHRQIQAIKELGAKAGVSLNPHNPPFLLDEILGEIDLVLLMSVNPGFGGQKFIEQTLNKISAVRSIIDEYDYECVIEVDGGINNITGEKCVKAGANILVAGSYIFNSPDYGQAIGALKE